MAKRVKSTLLILGPRLNPPSIASRYEPTSATNMRVNLIVPRSKNLEDILGSVLNYAEINYAPLLQVLRIVFAVGIAKYLSICVDFGDLVNRLFNERNVTRLGSKPRATLKSLERRLSL